MWMRKRDEGEKEEIEHLRKGCPSFDIDISSPLSTPLLSLFST